jgi:hypothetical protein
MVKYFLVADVSKRLGMMKNGVDDVKNHPWIRDIDMKQLLSKKIPMIFRPEVTFPGDTSNFNSYPDSQSLPPPLKIHEDVFSDW